MLSGVLEGGESETGPVALGLVLEYLRGPNDLGMAHT